jgi:hypothetical protein
MAAIARPITCATTTAPQSSRRRKDHAAHQEKRKSFRSRSASSPPLGAFAPDDGPATFLKRSGLAAGAGAFASQLPYGAIGKAEAAKDAAAATEVKRTVCTTARSGCAVDATVENGVVDAAGAGFDSPLNLGAHCAKGASVREHGMHEHSHRSSRR